MSVRTGYAFTSSHTLGSERERERFFSPEGEERPFSLPLEDLLLNLATTEASKAPALFVIRGLSSLFSWYVLQNEGSLSHQLVGFSR